MFHARRLSLPVTALLLAAAGQTFPDDTDQIPDRMLKKAFSGFFNDGIEKMRFFDPLIFNDLPSLKMTPHPFDTHSPPSWRIQLQGQVDPSHPARIHDIDLFDSPVDLIHSLKAAGKTVICYFSAGSFESWRNDAHSFDTRLRGRPLTDWPGERWLDIRSPKVRTIMLRRLDLAVEKGCDGVDPDNMDGYRHDSGFALDAADQIDFNRFIAREAHRRKLLVGLKNDLEQIPELAGDFDFAVNEQCFQYAECQRLTPFIEQGKPVLNIEYSMRYVSDPAARRELHVKSRVFHFTTLVLPLALDGSFEYSHSQPNPGP